MKRTETDKGLCSHYRFTVGAYKKWCTRKSVVTEDGREWCRQHAPSSYKKRRDASSAEIKRRIIGYGRVDEIHRAQDAVVEAAKAWRKAGEETLADAVANLVEAVEVLEKLEDPKP